MKTVRTVKTMKTVKVTKEKEYMRLPRAMRLAAAVLVLLLTTPIFSPIFSVESRAAAAGTTLLSDGLVSAGGSWHGGGFELTNELAKDGQYSFRRIIPAGSEVRGHGSLLYSYQLSKPLNVTSMTDVRFALYVSDPVLLQDVGVQFELTSSGTCDVEENAVNTSYGIMAGGKLQAGWNEMCVSLETFKGTCDLTRFNYLRIYNTVDFTVGKKDFVIAVDWFRFTGENDTVLPISSCEDMAPGWGGVTAVPLNGVSFVGGSLQGDVPLGGAVCFYSAVNNGGFSVDATKKKYLTFRYYVSDAAAAGNTLWGVELSSSGKCDLKESQISVRMQDYTVDGVWQNGWNTVAIPLSAFGAGTGVDKELPDWTKINYFRMYCIEPHNVGDGYIFALADLGLWEGADGAAAKDAEEAKRTEHAVPVWGCNTAWGNGELDGDLAKSGSGCVKFRMVNNNINACTENYIGVVDATGMDTLEFDLYVSHAFILEDSFSGGNLEITSSGTCDQQEIHWDWPTIFKYAEGGVKVGEWNHVVLPLRTGGVSGGTFDISHVNFIRNFWLSLRRQDANAFIALDNFVLTDADAEYQAQLRAQCEEVLALYQKLGQIPTPVSQAESDALQNAVKDADALYETLIPEAKEVADESEEKSSYYKALKKLWQYAKYAALLTDMENSVALSAEEADRENTGHILQNLRRSYEKLTESEKAAVPAEAIAALEKAEASFAASAAEEEPTPTEAPTAPPTETPGNDPAEPTDKEPEPLDLTVRDYVFAALFALTIVIGVLIYFFVYRKRV